MRKKSPSQLRSAHSFLNGPERYCDGSVSSVLGDKETENRPLSPPRKGKVRRMIIRKATAKDLPGIIRIYDEIHTREETGEVTIGWVRGIYPTEKTAEESIQRGDMFVQVDKTGEIVGTGIINKTQVDAYADGDWQYPAADDEVMVLHTLIISVRPGHRGSGKAFLDFYESFAKENGCPYLRLDTNARNAVARAFYRKHGYDEIGIVPTVFNGIPGVDLVLLEKRLGDRGRRTVHCLQ